VIDGEGVVRWSYVSPMGVNPGADGILRALEDENLVEYAQDLGLDAAAVARDLAGHVYKTKVRDDFMGGVRSGVNGTPTFHISGVRFDDSWDPDTLTAALERAARLHK